MAKFQCQLPESKVNFLVTEGFFYRKTNFILSDFQLIVEQLKNEIRKGLQQGLAAYAAEYVGTKASSLFDAKKIQNKIKIDLLKGIVLHSQTDPRKIW